MKCAVLPLFYLAAGCSAAGPVSPSQSQSLDSCRSSDPPASCINPISFEIGGPQGVFLEGAGLERLHFTALGKQLQGVFPPPPGTRLVPTVACGEQQRPPITVNACKPVSDSPNVRGVFACQVDVQDGPGICDNPIDPRRPDPDPTHHRGVTIVRGAWDNSGAWKDDGKTVTLSCDAAANPNAQTEGADGAITKCARQWHIGPEASPNGFLACIRMARADYCGDGFPHTFPQTDVHVMTPVDPPTARDHFCSDPYCYEGSWSKDGAVCIARPRWNGDGMGFERCKDQFVQVGDQYCRGDSNAGVVFSRSLRFTCGQTGTSACGPEADPACVILDPGRSRDASTP